MNQAYAIRRDGAAFAWYEQAGSRIRVMDRAGASIADVPVTEFVEALALTDDGARLVAVEARRGG